MFHFEISVVIFHRVQPSWYSLFLRILEHPSSADYCTNALKERWKRHLYFMAEANCIIKRIYENNLKRIGIISVVKFCDAWLALFFNFQTALPSSSWNCSDFYNACASFSLHSMSMNNWRRAGAKSIWTFALTLLQSKSQRDSLASKIIFWSTLTKSLALEQFMKNLMCSFLKLHVRAYLQVSRNRLLLP